jgi:predicted N-acyltransferase
VRTDVIFLKDFFENGESHSRQLNDQEFYEFCVQPSMIFDLHREWHSFDDYLEALSSKYRVRAKRAFKKAAGVEKRLLNESQIWAYNDRIYALYEDIADAAGFNTFQLHPDYFIGLKQHLGERFQVYGYFLNGEMVGFFTTILNGEELEAHFIGYDENENHEHQLYLNMLFDMVKIGIEMRVKRVVFARTALEIKSSVGAEPHQLYCYIRHRNAFANRFIKPLVDYLKPEENWQPRKPFRE